MRALPGAGKNKSAPVIADSGGASAKNTVYYLLFPAVFFVAFFFADFFFVAFFFAAFFFTAFLAGFFITALPCKDCLRQTPWQRNRLVFPPQR